MNIFKAIFNGWIRPRMEYQAAQIAELSACNQFVHKTEYRSEVSSAQSQYLH